MALNHHRILSKATYIAMNNKSSLIGLRFERLKIIRNAEPKIYKYSHKTYRRKSFICMCDCGKEVFVTWNCLSRGKVKSCGCANIEHGFSVGGIEQPTYRSWKKMKARCTNPKHKHFKHYGGRGITVCERWINSFETFLKDMGVRPAGKSIERKNNNGNYEPDNCCWATRKEQMRNTSRNTVFTVFGITACLKDLAAHFNKSYTAIRHRIVNLGLDPEFAFTEPILNHKKGSRRCFSRVSHNLNQAKKGNEAFVQVPVKLTLEAPAVQVPATESTEFNCAVKAAIVVDPLRAA